MDKKVLSVEGKELRSITLNDSVFGREVNEATIYEAVKNELANRRVGTACTKGRSEVRGSGAKPWRQKGTGRARAGTRKSPIWVGGGITFGPKNRDYSYSIPKKVKRAAMKSLLSKKTAEDRLTIVEDFTVDSGKTKDFAKVITKLVPSERTVVVLKDDDKMIRRAGKNMPWISFLSYNRLRAHDLLYGKHVVVLESAVKQLNEFYSEA
ncbi:MAG: 50S ribosomal protein L4 [Spirochaetia bacterium]